MPSTFPAIDELLLNPVVAAAVIVIAVNVISYALSFKPTWLAIAVALAYMVGGYLATGRTTPEELFLAVVYALLIIAMMWLRPQGLVGAAHSILAEKKMPRGKRG